MNRLESQRAARDADVFDRHRRGESLASIARAERMTWKSVRDCVERMEARRRRFAALPSPDNSLERLERAEAKRAKHVLAIKRRIAAQRLRDRWQAKLLAWKRWLAVQEAKRAAELRRVEQERQRMERRLQRVAILQPPASPHIWQEVWTPERQAVEIAARAFGRGDD